MKNTSFKISLNKFLIEYWNDDSLVDILGHKTLHANCGDQCYKYEVVSNCIVRSEEIHLYCDHEEADSRMLFHVAYLAENYPSSTTVNVVVLSLDTDCSVIGIGCFHKLIEKNQSFKPN